VKVPGWWQGFFRAHLEPSQLSSVMRGTSKPARRKAARPARANPSKRRAWLHIAPWSKWKDLSRSGLSPSQDKMGVYRKGAHDKVHLLRNEMAAVEDIMTNYFVDEYPRTRYFAIIEVHPPEGVRVLPDPDFMNTFFTMAHLPPGSLRLVQKLDVGD